MSNAKSQETGAEQAVEGRVYAGQHADERRAERRDKFIQAGIQIFGRQGFSGATTRLLCAQAGLTQRYFYESFSGVPALFLAVAHRLSERLLAHIQRALMASAEPRVQLRGALSAYFSYLRENPLAARILLAEVFTAGSSMGALALGFNESLADLLRTHFEAHVPDPLPASIDVSMLTIGFIGATHHIGLRYWLGGFNTPQETVVATAFALYYGELRPLLP